MATGDLVNQLLRDYRATLPAEPQRGGGGWYFGPNGWVPLDPNAPVPEHMKSIVGSKEPLALAASRWTQQGMGLGAALSKAKEQQQQLAQFRETDLARRNAERAQTGQDPSLTRRAEIPRTTSQRSGGPSGVAGANRGLDANYLAALRAGGGPMSLLGKEPSGFQASGGGAMPQISMLGPPFQSQNNAVKLPWQQRQTGYVPGPLPGGHQPPFGGGGPPRGPQIGGNQAFGLQGGGWIGPTMNQYGGGNQAFGGGAQQQAGTGGGLFDQLPSLGALGGQAGGQSSGFDPNTWIGSGDRRFPAIPPQSQQVAQPGNTLNNGQALPPGTPILNDQSRIGLRPIPGPMSPSVPTGQRPNPLSGGLPAPPISDLVMGRFNPSTGGRIPGVSGGGSSRPVTQNLGGIPGGISQFSYGQHPAPPVNTRGTMPPPRGGPLAGSQVHSGATGLFPGFSGNSGGFGSGMGGGMGGGISPGAGAMGGSGAPMRGGPYQFGQGGNTYQGGPTGMFRGGMAPPSNPFMGMMGQMGANPYSMGGYAPGQLLPMSQAPSGYAQEYQQGRDAARQRRYLSGAKIYGR